MDTKKSIKKDALTYCSNRLAQNPPLPSMKNTKSNKKEALASCSCQLAQNPPPPQINNSKSNKSDALASCSCSLAQNPKKNKKRSIKKHAQGSHSCRLAQPQEQVWKLRKWLFCEKLIVCHELLRNMDFEELINLTPGRLNIRLVPGLVCRVCESFEVVKLQQHLCRQMMEKILTGTDVKEVLSQLHRVQPSPFEILIGPIPKLFVDVLEVVTYQIRIVKPRHKKEEYQKLFLKLLLRTENNESFKDVDKARVIEWRKALRADMDATTTRNKNVSN